MGSMGGIKYSRLEMFRINSSVDDQRVDQVQHVADKFNHMVMNKECSGDKFASVPTRPRTPRVLIENQTYNFEQGVYYCSDLMIVDEKNSSPSKKHSRFEDFVVSEDGCEDFVVSDDHDYEEEESCSKKKQRKVERKTTVPRKPAPVYNLPTELPQNLQEYINGLNLEAPPLFVAQKLLTVTDVTAQQGRLLLPRSLINAEFFDNFLTEVEMDLLDTEAIEVNLVDDKLREFYDLRMKRWVKTSNKDYVLQKVWNKVVAENNLGPLKVSKDNKDLTMVAMKDDENRWKTDVVALVWCFRRGSKIWFAFHTQAMTEFNI
ncbi:hypothetical protein POM88_019497 [Heracleum sosnowskyi]|uniref:Uncharacterized protein n=1 Tax=Heracleum sosnowskyi TaxID=360622 RepID=A0AAD8ID41_9APIA|nr:hypothetical protein POM88_019495 [Heracleum sosnowskyi]KAK1381762.1 hypothetical protein POM88_019497 [Heracleum sosnowskyi]